jgi:hypothetical protein
MTLPVPTPEERAHQIRHSVVAAAIAVFIAGCFGVAGIFGLPNFWVGAICLLFIAALHTGNAIVAWRGQRREQ